MPRIHGTPAVSWWNGSNPASGPVGTSNIWVGHDIDFDVPGRVMGFAMYRTANDIHDHWALLWNENAAPLVVKLFWALTAWPSLGWQNAHIFRSPIRVTVGANWHFAVNFPGGGYYRTVGALTNSVRHNHINFQRGFTNTGWDPPNGGNTTDTNAKGIDILFQPD